jgi:molybdate transport system substrate-binding protein
MQIRITGISSMATRDFLSEMAAVWSGTAPAELVIESVGGVDAARRVLDGEPFDLVVLASDAIDRLAAAGRLVDHPATALLRSSVAIAVRRGAPHPPIDSGRALREAVRSAPSLACSTGPSGRALQQLFNDWGIAEEIRDRIVQPPPGVPVGALLARGDAALGFQQLSELMHVEGVDVVGAMPPGLEIVTTFSGAVCTTSAHAELAQSALDFMLSPAAAAVAQRHGLAPA